MPFIPRTDILGSNQDEEGIDTLHGMAYENLKHNHSVGSVYPSLAAGVTLSCVNDGATWTLGTITEIVPANTILNAFDIHHVLIESASADSTYCLVLYQGAGDVEIGRARFTRDASGGLAITSNIPFITPLIPANARVRARVASAANNGETITISIFYHTY